LREIKPILMKTSSYYPYGGLMGSGSMGVQPYKYGGKELDRENGLDLYDSHARMYDPIIGRTTTIDPLAEKYTHLSPYLWCAANPLKYVDPSGMDWYQNNDTKYYTWFEEDNKKEGFKHIGGKGSLVGEFEPHINKILENVYKIQGGLYSENLTIDLTNKNKGAIKPTNWFKMDNLLNEFLLGCGPEISILDDNHPYTKSLHSEEKVIKGQHLLRSNNTDVPGTITKVAREWGLWNVLTNPQISKQFIGSYSFDAYTSEDGKSLLNIVYDTKNVKSFLYHVPFSDLLNHSRGSFIKPMSTTYQFYIWKSRK
jgi:RHS repeat-associated protein